ncbi:MAG: hypothetical protein JXR22_10070 [Prolixibacteraceae bacterium]|nr:hypothetical protein [Prolixibacteraceae bacterium]
MKLHQSILKTLLVLAVTCLFFSCGPSQREKAVQQINMAKQSIMAGDTLRAIAQLDSVSLKYPKASVQQVVAKNMIHELYRQLIESLNRELTMADSVIGLLETKFIKEKTANSSYFQYLPKRHSFDRTWNRSFIQVNLDERGELFLSSNYMGKEWLDHTAIRVYDGPLQAKTENVETDHPLNHRSEFLDYKWERVSYMQGKSDSVIHFIANHRDLKLKCVFLGKQYHYILLEQYDIDSVVDALELSEAIRKRNRLMVTIDELRKKYQAYNN